MATLFLYVAFGLALGGFYFGGLWLTVRHATNSRRPKGLLVLSFLARAAVVLAGFYAAIRWAGPQWEAVALTLLGFMVARVVLVRRWGPELATEAH